MTAATEKAGVALINGTQTILTATVPDDGKVHLATFRSVKRNTGAITGGTLAWHFTPATTTTTVETQTTQTGAGGYHFSPSVVTYVSLPVYGGSPITLEQTVALTAGASKVWASILIF